VIAELDANVDTVNIEERDGINAAIDFTIEVRNRVHLAAILRRLRQHPEPLSPTHQESTRRP